MRLDLQHFGRLWRNTIRVVAFDTETTGLRAEDHILQIAWQPFIWGPSGVTDRGETSCQMIVPRKPISKRALEVHGITTGKASNGKSVGKVISCFLEAVEKSDVIIAHNASFDLRFVKQEIAYITRHNPKRGKCLAQKFEHPSFCTMDILRQLKLQSLKLVDVYRDLCGRQATKLHDAKADVEALVDIMECDTVNQCLFEVGRKRKRSDPERSLNEQDEGLSR